MIEGIPVAEWAPESLLGLTIVLIFVGWLVPRWYVRGLESRVAALEAANAALLAQNAEMLETTRLARSTWLALTQQAGDR